MANLPHVTPQQVYEAFRKVQQSHRGDVPEMFYVAPASWEEVSDEYKARFANLADIMNRTMQASAPESEAAQ